VKILILAALAALPLAAELDRYGGDTALACAGGARPHFYVEKLGGRWYFCTPAGNVYLMNAVYNLQFQSGAMWDGLNGATAVDAKYKTATPRPTMSGRFNWTYYSMLKLRSWGFNALDMFRYVYAEPWTQTSYWLTPDRTTPPDAKLPTIVAPNVGWYAAHNAGNRVSDPLKNIVQSTLRSIYSGWRAGAIYDYHSPVWPEYLDAYWRANPPPARHSDYVLGVVVDETDHLWWVRSDPRMGFQTMPQAGQHGTHAGWATLVAAPTQTANYEARTRSGANVRVVFRDPKLWSKHSLAEYLERVHGTIGELNAHWGSSYTTFGSTGRQHAQIAAGATTQLRRPARFSLQIYVGADLWCGDDPNNDDPAVGNLICRAGSPIAGSIDYATGVLTLTGLAEGAAAAVNYVECGFGCGTGLLDEDGRHAWVPRWCAGQILKGGTAELYADLDHWLYQFARRYFGVVRQAHDRYWPGYLYLGPTSLGGWQTPASAPVLRAASEYVDVYRIGQLPFGAADIAQRIEHMRRYGGDKPWTYQTSVTATADSPFFGDPRVKTGGCRSDQLTQAARGAAYEQMIARHLELPETAGFSWWGYVDLNRQCENFGLVTYRDNAYDGVEARIAAGVDQWGWPTGGELRDYGDFLTPVTRANRLWRDRLAPAVPTGE
jgi:hypothetical protein